MDLLPIPDFQRCQWSNIQGCEYHLNRKTTGSCIFNPIAIVNFEIGMVDSGGIINGIEENIAIEIPTIFANIP